MYRLLIVDDEPAIAEGLAEMITELGLPLREISYSFSANEALRKFDQEPFDIVLADIRMPEMDGLQLVQRLRERWRHTAVIFLTGFSDFDYARRALQLGALNYLLKPAEDEEVVVSLKEAISQLDQAYHLMLSLEEAERLSRQAIPLMQDKWWGRMLHGEVNVRTLSDSAFSQKRIPLSVSLPVWTLIVRIDDFGRRFHNEDEFLLLFAVQNMVQELWAGQYRVESFRFEGWFVLLLQTEDQEQSREQWSERVSIMHETVQRVLGITFSMVLTPEPSSWDKWPDAFWYAESALRLCAFSSTLLVTPERDKATAIHYQLLHKITQELSEALKARDEARFKRCLDSAFAINGLELPSPEQLAIHYIAIANQLSQFLLLYNLQNQLDPQTADRLGNFKSHRDVGSMKSFLIQLFNHISNKMGAVRDNPSDLLIAQVRAYIHQHLEEDLSLNALAKLKYVSPSYLSRLFHQITGEQLMSYITRVRMEEAKKLLLDDRYRIQDISEKLGFQSANYFSKVFRKTVGIPPQDFRSSSLSNS
ncbi:response regulator transcription factor [Paenibacillus lignilyticus]|uniref:Response regulator n=1 Tax=Paenibacillus lignilyticus TaxID=1172615 RepID=A0ABS5C9T6_9BACL|nr:response regulator [Paenibacillus lignilyticus]MBP3961858.1 response regulator [Paenibacillus lignilyticus]MBP3963471.1 response regulator [Paenibacillus lignilyticus]